MTLLIPGYSTEAWLVNNLYVNDCIRSDQSTLDAGVSHRFEANVLIGDKITELKNRLR